jgi:hypothetical protein
MKRIVIVSDFHCGHKFGLTPPGWWASEQTPDERLKKHKEFQRDLWDFYASKIEMLKPIHTLVVNGDAIEGKGEKTGGTELVTSDRFEQIRMAAKAIELAEAKRIRVTYGTGFHTGREEDFEKLLREFVSNEDVKVEGHLFLDVDGCIFDIKHKVARSIIPHGRVTALIRAVLWNGIWSLLGRQPEARFIVRSHVHYYEAWKNARHEAVITPAFQYNTIYGIRECEGTVDLGLVYFDVESDGRCPGHVALLADFKSLCVEAEKL